ncbi:MAG: T9SS type A sorting domain-containing protein [Saprospiraceae bacterium]
MKKNLLLLIFLGLFSQVFSQKIVDIELQQSLTKDQLGALFFGFSVNNGVEAYKVLYETMDTDGTIDTASGLMVLPIPEIENQQFPFLAYQHGTASNRNAVPSNMDAGERTLIYYFAGQGYYTTAADYLGLGESRRTIHPYVHAATEASAAIDLVAAAKTYVDEQKLLNSGQLFITGYSQGGHAGMAMHKALNETGVAGLTVAAGSHMSGIYNMTGELLSASLSEDVYQFPSYVVWIIVGYQSVYGNLYNELSEIFLPPYVPLIQGFLDGTTTRGELNELLVAELEKNHGASIPKFLLTDTFSASFEGDANGPFQTALRDNNLFDWIPNSPMRMMYCMADDQVAFTNSTFTDSVMNANGAMDVLSVDVNSTADHGGCVIPATFATVIFFDQFVNRDIISSTKDLDLELSFKVQPNPATDYIILNFNNTFANVQDYQLRLINYNGQTVATQQTNNLQNFRFPLNEISSGLYLMQVQSENGFWTEKILIK